MGRMSIDEVIDEMRRASEVNLERAERCRYANSMQPSIYDVEAGVQYSEAAEKYAQVAEWLDELKIRINADNDLIGSGALNNAYRQGYGKAVEDCACVVSRIIDCRYCPIDCGVHTVGQCEKAVKVYLQEHLEGGSEDASKS